jgi:hypothetical protein
MKTYFLKAETLIQVTSERCVTSGTANLPDEYPKQ